MKTITLTLDEETYRRVSLRAAELRTSVDELVKEALSGMQARSGEATFVRLKQKQDEVRARISSFSASDRLSRTDLYDRAR